MSRMWNYVGGFAKSTSRWHTKPMLVSTACRSGENAIKNSTVSDKKNKQSCVLQMPIMAETHGWRWPWPVKWLQKLNCATICTRSLSPYDSQTSIIWNRPNPRPTLPEKNSKPFNASWKNSSIPNNCGAVINRTDPKWGGLQIRLPQKYLKATRCIATSMVSCWFLTK